MISCCVKAARGYNDRFAFCSFVTLPFLLSSFLFYLVLFPCYSVFPFILFPCYFAFPFIQFSLLSCLVSLLLCLSFYPISLLLCLPFIQSCFPCNSVFPLPCLFFIFLPSTLSTCQPVHSSTLCL